MGKLADWRCECFTSFKSVPLLGHYLGKHHVLFAISPHLAGTCEPNSQRWFWVRIRAVKAVV